MRATWICWWNLRADGAFWIWPYLKNELEDAVERRVDLLTYKSLHPLLKERILAEQVPIL